MHGLYKLDESEDTNGFNQNMQHEKEQITQWPKEKNIKEYTTINKTWQYKYTTTDRVTQTTINSGAQISHVKGNEPE